MGFGLFSSPGWALICRVYWASPLGLMSSDVMPWSLCAFDTFLVLCLVLSFVLLFLLAWIALLSINMLNPQAQA